MLHRVKEHQYEHESDNRCGYYWGGVIGCSIAYQLSKAGVQVSILEHEEIEPRLQALLPGYLLRLEVLTGPKAGADLFLASWSMTAEIHRRD